MLMGAAHNALWAFNARVSLSCLHIIAQAAAAAGMSVNAFIKEAIEAQIAKQSA